MKILIAPNLLFQYIKLDEIDEENSKRNIECIICGFKMGEYNVCHLKCFKRGSQYLLHRGQKKNKHAIIKAPDKL